MMISNWGLKSMKTSAVTSVFFCIVICCTDKFSKLNARENLIKYQFKMSTWTLQACINAFYSFTFSPTMWQFSFIMIFIIFLMYLRNYMKKILLSGTRRIWFIMTCYIYGSWKTPLWDREVGWLKTWETSVCVLSFW